MRPRPLLPPPPTTCPRLPSVPERRRSSTAAAALRCRPKVAHPSACAHPGNDTPENKFAVPIDVVIPHATSVVNVLFGAELERPATEGSWGVSDVQIMLR